MVTQERIFVTVRVKPLSKNEVVEDEISAWECINDNTIKYKNTRQEKPGFPTAFKFDRVFCGDISTREVYDAGVKETALSVVKGINCTIFAYGQTSTGKTYTMKGITRYAIEDIFDYLHIHEERTFVLKFSAIEIYNEVVRDLLNVDGQPLRVMDDPVKGPVIEKLIEEIVWDLSHLKHLISVCEVRQTRESVLNENSSRSHQILKLTVESSARKLSCNDKPMKLSATVNFVDLAGSERVSTTMSSGPKLKEGLHINRSLLTLGTVIRKLRGKHGHINYRDSKLTRILQTSIGGNARTAIICTLSPEKSHVEQSRNTLLFARCAKQVSTNASVNAVKSGKCLVDQLQKEILRLEKELEKKDLQLEKIDKDIRETSAQRDLAESRVKELQLIIENLENMVSQTANPQTSGVVEIEEEEPIENKLTQLHSNVEYPSSSFSSESLSFCERALAEALIQNLQASEVDGVQSVHSFVKGLKEAHAHYEEHIIDSQELLLNEKLRTNSSECINVTVERPEALLDWPQEFERLQKIILDLWQICNVPLVHRTYFFLLFKGDPSDKIYMEVELRRLKSLKNTLSSENQLPKDDPRSITASVKALSQERKMLLKLMRKRYTNEERNMLFQKWGIPLESKGRKLQLLISIWTKTDDLQHITESAEIVANLIKFAEKGQGIKEMLGLSFSSPHHRRSWRDSIASLI